MGDQSWQDNLIKSANGPQKPCPEANNHDPTSLLNPKYFVGAKPHTHQTNLWHLHPAIVKRLVPLPNFVNWRWQLNEKRDAWTKVPYQPRDPTKRAATNDKGTWGTYAEAVVNVEAGKADGIGFCLLATNICAFDIDNCRDLATGKIDPVATALIARCGATYVEETVSGTGLRVIGLGGTKYVNRKQKVLGSKVSIESYRNCARYITISGMTFDGVKPDMPDLGNIDALITSVVEELDHQTDASNAKADNTTNTTPRNDHKANAFTGASLPPDLARLIRDGVPITEDRSAAFYHAIKWLSDLGWSLDDIIDLLARHPGGISAKYGLRFAGEAARAFGKPDKSNDKTNSKAPTGSNSNNQLRRHAKVAEELFRKMNERGYDLRVVADEKGNEHTWLYRAGLWSLLLNAAAWLDHQIELTLRDMKLCAASNAKFIYEARKYIERSPNVRTQDQIIWDDHGKIPTRAGLIDPVTLAIEPLKKEDYATWCLDVEYDPAATCPVWSEMLGDFFTEQSATECEKRVILLQDFMGTTLIDRKPKSLRRALVLLGPSDTGKSSLLRVMSGLLTDKPISTPFSDISGPHGLQEFTRRAPWVLDEAFDIGVWHLSSRVKAIISGDPQSINPKGVAAITMRMKSPCLWGTNHPPTFKENTDAMVNRVLILKLRRVFRKGEFVGVAAKARAINPSWEPADLILHHERSGILNWALIGLQRVLKRGNFVNTDEGESALDEMRLNSNPVAGFIHDCISFDADLMMSTLDFYAAFTGWRQETHGDDKTSFSRSFVGKNLSALSHPLIGQDKDAFKENGVRYYLGVALNDEGRAHFQAVAKMQAAKNEIQFQGMSPSADKVGRYIPGKWRDHPEVVKLKKRPAQETGGTPCKQGDRI